MKIHIDIDCTPEEARAFLGLPDLQPMQAAVLERMQARLLSALDSLEPEQLMRAWMQGTLPGLGPESLQGAMQGWEQLQKAFWSQMSAAAGRAPDKS